MIVSSSIDKKIIFWDVMSKIAKQVIHLDKVSVEWLVYSVDYWVLFASSYEKYLQAFSFDTNDCYEAGKLLGHTATITAMEILKDTPMIVTVDEINFVKTWDIRDFRCV